MELKKAFIKIAVLIDAETSEGSFFWNWKHDGREMSDIVAELYRRYEWIRELSTGELHLIINALIVGYSGGDPIPWLLADPDKTLASYDQEIRLLEDQDKEIADGSLRHAFKFYRSFYDRLGGMDEALPCLEIIQEIRRREYALNHH